MTEDLFIVSSKTIDKVIAALKWAGKWKLARELEENLLDAYDWAAELEVT